MSAPSLHDDLCGPAEAARLLGLPYPSSFAVLRRRLERVVVLADGAREVLGPVPAFARHRPVAACSLTAAQRSENTRARERERAWRAEHVVVVPAWGGASIYGGEWRFRRSLCRAWRDRLTEAA